MYMVYISKCTILLLYDARICYNLPSFQCLTHDDRDSSPARSSPKQTHTTLPSRTDFYSFVISHSHSVFPFAFKKVRRHLRDKCNEYKPKQTPLFNFRCHFKSFTLAPKCGPINITHLNISEFLKSEHFWGLDRRVYS